MLLARKSVTKSFRTKLFLVKDQIIYFDHLTLDSQPVIINEKRKESERDRSFWYITRLLATESKKSLTFA